MSDLTPHTLCVIPRTPHILEAFIMPYIVGWKSLQTPLNVFQYLPGGTAHAIDMTPQLVIISSADTNEMPKVTLNCIRDAKQPLIDAEAVSTM